MAPSRLVIGCLFLGSLLLGCEVEAVPVAAPGQPPPPPVEVGIITPPSCKPGTSPGAKDFDSCRVECQSYDDLVPAGSHCNSPRVACLAECSAKFGR